MKYYIIPETDIKDLERARKQMYNLIEYHNIHLATTIPMTQAMYKITHRRYPVAPFPKLYKFLTKHKLWGIRYD